MSACGPTPSFSMPLAFDKQVSRSRGIRPPSDTARAAKCSTARFALEEVANTSDVLDVPRVASLLHVGRNTIYALVSRNAIPHRRLGKAIRFSRSAVMSWLSSWSSQDAKEGNRDACTTRFQNWTVVLPSHHQDPRRQEASNLRHAWCSRVVPRSRSNSRRGLGCRATRDS